MARAHQRSSTVPIEASGRVFDISRGCVDDGPGLRTVVFLKGCNLGCPWCHNIEGRSRTVHIAHDDARCIRCGLCAAACGRGFSVAAPEAWRTDCTGRGLCVDACPSGARRRVGRDLTVRQLVAEVIEDGDFFVGTGGGVTFSGGEPLLQADFLFACATRLRARGIHVAVETAGFWPPSLASDLAASVDLVLFDLKHVDLPRMRRFLGRDCSRILANLTELLHSKVAIELRITLVPGFNDAAADLTAIARWIKDAGDNVPPVRLLPAHRLAAAKEAIYALPFPYRDMAPPDDARMDRAAALLARLGVPAERA